MKQMISNHREIESLQDFIYGGSDGKIHLKTDLVDKNGETVGTELPTISGNAGKILAVNSGATGVEWKNEKTELPAISENAGKILAVNSGATGVEWKSVSSGTKLYKHVFSNVSITGGPSHFECISTIATPVEVVNGTLEPHYVFINALRAYESGFGDILMIQQNNVLTCSAVKLTSAAQISSITITFSASSVDTVTPL